MIIRALASPQGRKKEPGDAPFDSKHFYFPTLNKFSKIKIEKLPKYRFWGISKTMFPMS